MKQKIIFPILGLGALAFGAALLLLLRVLDPRNAHALAPIAQLPEFALVDQTGAAFTQRSLSQSDVWVADFIFTSCTGTCPGLTSQMKKLATRAPSNVRFISFTVDPERDTPEALATYAAKVPADPARWSFVTGEASKVREAVVSGFKMTADKVQKGAGEYDVVHGNWFVLGDGSGKIRGYYHVDSDEELEVLARDVALLADRRGAS